MGLVERLEGSFTDLLGGSLSGSFASFDEALSKEPGVAPPIDPAQIGALTASFTAQAPDFGSIASLAAERVSSAAAVVPGAQDLLRPLMSGIELAERAMSERDFVSRIGGLTRGRREVSGIDSIAGVFDGLSSARNDSGIGLVFELLPAILPMPLDLDRAQSKVSTTGGALMDLMRALRGPMAIATALEDLDRTVSIVGDLLNVRAFQTARVRLDAAVPG